MSSNFIKMTQTLQNYKYLSFTTVPNIEILHFYYTTFKYFFLKCLYFVLGAIQQHISSHSSRGGSGRSRSSNHNTQVLAHVPTLLLEGAGGQSLPSHVMHSLPRRLLVASTIIGRQSPFVLPTMATGGSQVCRRKWWWIHAPTGWHKIQGDGLPSCSTLATTTSVAGARVGGSGPLLL